MKRKTAWITWERQQRNISMARIFDADYFEITSNMYFILRYAFCVYSTCKIFLKDYENIFVQNPSIILSFVAVIASKVFGKKVIIDAHNAGVRPAEGRWWMLQLVNRWILKRSNLVLVSNVELQNYLTEFTVNCIVIPDPLPQISVARNSEYTSYDVLFVCSWSEDEPILEYIEAARSNGELTFAITGNYRKFVDALDRSIQIPRNLRLMGFIDEVEYYYHIKNSSLVVDLTTRLDCLVCGAYEAISLGNLVLLTNSEVNRSLFGSAAAYSDLNCGDVGRSIVRALAEKSDLAKVVQNFKFKYAIRIEQLKEVILSEIERS